MTLLANKHVLITGSRGIALSTGLAFARSGALVTFLSRTRTNLDAATTALTKEVPDYKSRCIEGDISQSATWKKLDKELQSSSQNIPPIDILVNAAGIAQNSLLVRTSDDEVEQMLDVNLKGTILGCRWFAKHQIRNKRTKDENTMFSPVIVNLSSLLGLRGGRGATVYAASKAGIIGLTRALSQELASQEIRVNAVVPGYIETDMIQSERDQ